MQLKDSQFTIIHNELKSTPLLPWEMVKKLLWDLDKNLMEDIDCIAQECNWHFKYFIDGFSHFKNYSIVIADKDLTICAASSNIYDMTGYTAEEMVGNRPSILQGVDTNEDSKFILKMAPVMAVRFTVFLFMMELVTFLILLPLKVSITLRV